MQHVEQLALVLVNPLDLHVEQGIRADGDAREVRDVVGQAPLVGRLYRGEGALELWFAGQRLETLQVIQAHAPFGADASVDQARQIRIGQCQPAARRDAVGAIDQARGEQAIEVGEDGFAQQLRMQLRHTVDLVAGQHRQIGHAHASAVALVDQRDPLQEFDVAAVVAPDLVQEQFIDIENDLHVARQHALQHGHRPGLQSLRHQGVVGV